MIGVGLVKDGRVSGCTNDDILQCVGVDGGVNWILAAVVLMVLIYRGISWPSTETEFET